MFKVLFTIPLLLGSIALHSVENQSDLQYPLQDMSCKKPKQGPTGPAGPAGTQGPAGAAGATGPTGPGGSGLASSGSATITEVQVIPNTAFPGVVVAVGNQLINNNMPLAASAFTVQNTGVYIFSFVVSGSINDSVTGLPVPGVANFALLLNGTLSLTTGFVASPSNISIQTTTEFTVSGSILVNAAAGDTLSLGCITFSSSVPTAELTFLNVYITAFEVQ